MSPVRFSQAVNKSRPSKRISSLTVGNVLPWLAILFGFVVFALSVLLLPGGAFAPGGWHLWSKLVVAVLATCLLASALFIALRLLSWREGAINDNSDHSQRFAFTGCHVNSDPFSKERIWDALNAESWRQFHGHAFVSSKAFCVGSSANGSRMASLAEDLSAHFQMVDLCDEFDAVLASLIGSPKGWSLLVVDVDHVERQSSLEEIVQDLIEFREAVPAIAVVLISRGFGSDESDLIRAPIADYCFRASVGNGDIVKALPVIMENNVAWNRKHQRESADKHGLVLPFKKADV